MQNGIIWMERENRSTAYSSNARRVFFLVGRCVRLGENPISDGARKQICDTRTVSEREYKVIVSRYESTRVATLNTLFQ